LRAPPSSDLLRQTPFAFAVPDRPQSAEEHDALGVEILT
jgi:hypothetical protein